jgi:hypothetical protein
MGKKEDRGAVEMQSLGGSQMPSMPQSPRNSGRVSNNNERPADNERGRRRRGSEGMELNDVGGLLFMI